MNMVVREREKGKNGITKNTKKSKHTNYKITGGVSVVRPAESQRLTFPLVKFNILTLE
jgi:hypothetical protein